MDNTDHRPSDPAEESTSRYPTVPSWDAPPTVGTGGGQAPSAAPAPSAPEVAAPPPLAATYAGAGRAAPAPTFRSWQPGIIALRPLSFGDFLAAPFKAMRFNRGVIIGGPLLFTLASTALAVTALWLLFNDPELGLLSPSLVANGISTETVVVGVLALIAVLLADVLSSTIIAPGVARAVQGEHITLRQAWEPVRKKLGHVLLLYVITTTALTAVVVLAAIPLIIAIASASTLWIVLGVLLVIVVMVPAAFIVTLISGLARPIIVLEQIGAIAALSRSIRLMKGRFWWSVLIVFVTALLINIATSVLQTGGQLVASVGTLIAPENTTVVLISFFVFYGLAMVVSFVITYAYMGSVFTLMYVDMRMRHEGFDLDLARSAEARARR